MVSVSLGETERATFTAISSLDSIKKALPSPGSRTKYLTGFVPADLKDSIAFKEIVFCAVKAAEERPSMIAVINKIIFIFFSFYPERIILIFRDDEASSIPELPARKQ